MEESLDFLANLTLGNLNIILGLAIIGHQGKKTIIRDIELFKFIGWAVQALVQV
jgi:hypothetical protein